MTTTNGQTYRVRAILFDMDGTLVNSTAVVERTWTRFAERHDLDASEVIAACHGRRTAETVAEFVPSGVSVERETAIIDAEEVADVEGVVEVEGAAPLLASLPVDRWALVTSADRELAMRRMAAAGLPLPPVTITAEDVVNGKLAPDGFLAAAQALGVSPADCLIFEDAPAGLQAAHTSGAQVIAVGMTRPEAELVNETWIHDFTALRVRVTGDRQLDVWTVVPARL